MAYDSTATITPTLHAPATTQDGHTIVRNADGTITVEGPSVLRAHIPQPGEFGENLVEKMGRSECKSLAMRLSEFARVDKDSRKDWEEREKRALHMMGIKDIPKQEEEETGHNMTHPMLMEATARFQANAITELFPPMGPAETKVLGNQTQPKMARAMRIRTFVNHYLTDLDEGYFADTDRMLMYLPMGGSVFRRAGLDYTTGLPILRHVKATNFIAPYAGTDLATMPRYAWQFTMTGEDIDQAMQIGMFAEISLPRPPSDDVHHAPSADASDLREPILHEQDRLYEMLEYHIDLVLEADDKGAGGKLRGGDIGRRPYIVTMDASNDEILCVRRNWRRSDEKRKKRIWFAHHQFLPGLGFYGWGYPHVIGSLGLAASGAVNSLLDAALMANFQGGFVTKEGRTAGEYRLEPGVWKQVDSTAEELAKSFYTPPFKEPSPALFQMLGILVQAGQRFSGTTEAAVGEGNNNGPVGTTVALIEQAAKPINAIHKRLHVSMSQELQMLCELIHEYMPDQYDYQIGDESHQLMRQDFAPGVQILCVTDPSISSDTQRIMRAQAVMDLQARAPTLYPPQQVAEAHRRMLVALKVPNVDAIGPVVEQPRYLDAVAENTMILAGKPVRVYPEQDDAAHIAIHQDAVQRAGAMFPPEVFEKMIQPAFQAHIRDHMAQAYYKQVMTAAGLQPRFDAKGLPITENPQQERQITAQVAQAIAKLPHPQPKPGTPSFEQQQQQQKMQLQQAAGQADMDQKEQAFQAEERRKQVAFDNEQRRKDQAMAFQEARLDAAGATELLRTGITHEVELARGQDKHAQAIVHRGQQHQQHQQAQQQAADSHQQGMAQADAENAQGLAHADQVAKNAAGEEADADAHTGAN